MSTRNSLLVMATFFLLIGCVGVRRSDAAASAKDTTTPIGVAKIDITPETPVQMYGYASRKTESEGVAGRLSAKALAIGGDQGDGPVVLLTVDNGSVPATICEEVFRRVNTKVRVKLERFVLNNAHIHSGPNIKFTSSLPPEHRKHIDQYIVQLTDRLERVVLDALAARKPCQLAWTQGKVGFAANRRVLKEGKWTGFGAVLDAPTDHSLPLLRVTDAKGKLVAVVVNYACHCTTLRGNFKKIHGDWAGEAQKAIEADHPGTVAMICIGCAADADPYPHGTVELCKQHGRELADEVNRLLAQPMTPIEPKLKAQRVVLQVPYQKPPELNERMKRSYRLQALHERLEKGEKLQSEPYTITTWVFDDDLAMVFLTGEVVVDYVLRMKHEMDASRLWVSAYSHDVSSYIASNRIIQEGGYECRNSLSMGTSFGKPETLQPPMEDRIVRAVAKLLPPEFCVPKKAVKKASKK